MSKGGKREGAGRPKGEPTVRISVPVRFRTRVKSYIGKLKECYPWKPEAKEEDK